MLRFQDTTSFVICKLEEKKKKQKSKYGLLQKVLGSCIAQCDSLLCLSSIIYFYISASFWILFAVLEIFIDADGKSLEQYSNISMQRYGGDVIRLRN